MKHESEPKNQPEEQIEMHNIREKVIYADLGEKPTAVTWKQDIKAAEKHRQAAGARSISDGTNILWREATRI